MTQPAEGAKRVMRALYEHDGRQVTEAFAESLGLTKRQLDAAIARAGGGLLTRTATSDGEPDQLWITTRGRRFMESLERESKPKRGEGK